MYLYQYIIPFVLIGLLLVKPSRLGAFILLADQYVYYTLVLDVPFFYYYSICALINLITGAILQDKYFKSAMCSYLLVFVNIYGYLIWYNYIPPISYDMLSAVVVIAQLIGIFPDELYNGIHRAFKQFRLVRRTCFDNYQACVKMYKNTTTK